MREITNQQQLDDVAAMRERLPYPEDRRFALMAKRDDIRVVYDDDVELTNAQIFDLMDEFDYRMAGANFRSKTLVFEPRDTVEVR